MALKSLSLCHRGHWRKRRGFQEAQKGLGEGKESNPGNKCAKIDTIKEERGCHRHHAVLYKPLHVSTKEHRGEPAMMLMMVTQQGEFGNSPSLLSGCFLTHADSKAGAGAPGRLGTVSSPWSPGYPRTAELHPGTSPSTGSNHSPSKPEESLQVSSLQVNAKIPRHRC